MEELEYFVDRTVPCFITNGVKEVLSTETVLCILNLAFERGEELKSVPDKKASYFQVFNIEITKDKMITVEMVQEQPDIITKHIGYISDAKQFNGRVYIIEDWNGQKENVTVNDHYITILLPSEY